MAKLFGTKGSPQLNPFTFTETIHDVEADSVTIDVVLAEVDDGSGFSGVNDPASNVSWLSYSTSSSTPLDVTNVELDITVDPAGLEIGNTYRLELTASDGTDSLTVQRDIETLKETPLRTEGVSPTNVWDDLNTDYNDLSPADAASARANVDITSGDSGVIMEAGAGGTGMALWTDGTTLYFACGDGSGTGSTTSTAWITTPMPTGNDINIEWSANAATDTAALYIGGDLQGTDTFDNSEVSGTNEGGIARSHGGIRDITGGVDVNSDWDGTIDFVNVFTSFTTSDVS